MPRARPVSPRKAPSQRRSRELVDVLVRATARVLVRDGYEGCNTNRVAEVAGVSIGSVYQYFPNKEALVIAVMERHQAKIREAVAAHFASLGDASLDTAVHTLVRAMLDAHRIEPRLHQVLMEQVPRIGALKKLRAQHAAYQPMVIAWLEAHRDQLGVTDAGVSSFLLIAAVEGVLQRVLTERPGFIADHQLEQELTRLIVRYLGIGR